MIYSLIYSLKTCFYMCLSLQNYIWLGTMKTFFFFCASNNIKSFHTCKFPHLSDNWWLGMLVVCPRSHMFSVWKPLESRAFPIPFMLDTKLPALGYGSIYFLNLPCIPLLDSQSRAHWIFHLVIPNSIRAFAVVKKTCYSLPATTLSYLKATIQNFYLPQIPISLLPGSCFSQLLNLSPSRRPFH